MNIKEGDEITLEGIGPCRICRIYPSGSALVRDYEDRQWLVQRDLFWTAQTSLFNFAEEKK